MTHCKRKNCIHYDVCAFKACKFVCPYYMCNASGDLISRSELKKHKITTQQANGVEIEDIDVVPVACIDNAPAVQAYPFEQVQELVKLNQQFAQEIENLKRL